MTRFNGPHMVQIWITAYLLCGCLNMLPVNPLSLPETEREGQDERARERKYPSGFAVIYEVLLFIFAQSHTAAVFQQWVQHMNPVPLLGAKAIVQYQVTNLLQSALLCFTYA